MKRIILLVLLVALLNGCLISGHTFRVSKMRNFAEQNNLDFDCVYKINSGREIFSFQRYKIDTTEGRKEMVDKCEKEEK